ncbi:phosphopantetheine-binding protein [Cellulosilyticum ruminicola]|uniref:phosphopantetheine-binding protein n=1 Tax=Cellulosilyticum ruminicola TaxID=425254 RepID=UPI0006D15405|nr:phosphopantetheine-binding protein [Cellulosilyticum ruminicola]
MENLKVKIKELIIESLELEDVTVDEINEDASLFSAYDEQGDGLGLDSVDSLEIVVAIKREFGIKITEQDIGALQSVNTLASFIEEHSEQVKE